MTEQITNIRQQLDQLARMTQTLKEVKVEKGPGIHIMVMSDEVADCAKSLLYSKAHMGKFLGILKQEIVKNPASDPKDEPNNIYFPDVARACHEANKSYCESIGDTSQVSWDDAQDWQKESAIAGVKFLFENPETTPEGQHAAWSKDKIADGWSYGEVKDAEAKTHPCLVPYDQLPEAQREKDVIFQRTARSFFTPYANEGTRKTVADIEPTSDKTEFKEEDWGSISHIERIDVIRSGIGAVCKDILALKEEETTLAGKIHTTSSYNHACEARFAIGFELERIRNNG
ncbi:MAG: RyR domain-containing protein [Bacteroidota bacterium]